MQPLLRFACLTAFLLNTDPLAAGNDDHDAPLATKPSAVSDADDDRLDGAGIVTEPLKRAMNQPELNAYGTVVSLESLLTLRQQYLATQAQQDSAEATYQEADLNLKRTRNLYQHDIVSARRLQEQQARWRNDKANLANSRNQQQAILATSRLQWGNTLTEWFTLNQGKQAEQFLSHHAQLLQITLPPDVHLNSDVRSIAVDERGRRDRAIKATLISAAPQVDPTTQGERYFFKSQDRNLPFGAHISAWIASGNGNQNAGVVIPKHAVVWHLGQAFVFIKSEDGGFNRRVLPEQISSEEGYFAATGFEPGEEIVTTGAQTLLSEELKNLIPSEDDD